MSVILLGALLILFVLGVGVAAQPAARDPEIKVEDVVTLVKKALQDTANSTADLPPLKSVTITLAAIAETTTDGKVTFFVKGSGSKTKTASQQIAIVLIPPKPQKSLVPADDKMYRSLKEALTAAANAAKAANAAGGIALALDGFSAQIGLDVKGVRGGGLEISIGPLTLGGGVTQANVASNRIAVVFENPQH